MVQTLQRLHHVSPAWVLLAIASEAASLVVYALIIQRLLRLGGVDASVPALLGVTVVGIAMLNSLPGGGAVSGVYWYQQLRRRGADRPLAAIVLLAASVTGLVTLVYLILVGIAVAGSHSVFGGVRGPILIGAALFLAVRIYFHTPIARGFRWLARRTAGPDERIVAQHVPARGFATLMLLGYLNWLLDCVTLLAALLAVHATVPWAGILVAYSLGQLIANLPFLPGGGGSVEATLALGLVAVGGRTGAIVAGVILFRLISAWGIVPLGWAIWALPKRRCSHDTAAVD
jgi:putative heme transporter